MMAFPSVRDLYLLALPEKPYCTNSLGRRLYIRRKDSAVTYAMIQHNAPLLWQWLVFDIDSDDADTRAEDRGCPPPTFVALNRDNGHGHAAYLLETPVSAFQNSSRKAIKFYEDVERAMTYKLGADRSYGGFLSKNPLSPRWVAHWQASIPYRLDTLNDYLTPRDKNCPQKHEPSAIGRNVTIFDAVRAVAYRECLNFKKTGKSLDCFTSFVFAAANAVNLSFTPKLSHAEVKGIARSVADWTWTKFSWERFSAIQGARSQRRWAKSPTLTATRPWEALGVSRRTWERRRKQGNLQLPKLLS